MSADDQHLPRKIQGLQAATAINRHADPGWMVRFAPMDALLLLQDVPLDQIHPEQAGNKDYRWSGHDWATGGYPVFDGLTAIDLERIGELNDTYERLELGIQQGDPVPPVILARRDDGTYTSLDGHHRTTISRSLGRETIQAYVYDERLGWDLSMSADELSEAEGQGWAFDPERADAAAGTVSGEKLGHDSRFELEMVSLDDIHDDFDEDLSGAEFDDPGSDTYRQLERALRESWQAVRPLVLVRDEDGDLLLEDGRHRLSISRHLGLTHLPAYVHDAALEIEQGQPKLSSLDETAPAVAPPPAWLPATLYHWTEGDSERRAEDLEGAAGPEQILSSGFDEGVFLTVDGEHPSHNSNIYDLRRPVRIEVSTAGLDPALLAPDHGAWELDEDWQGEHEAAGRSLDDVSAERSLTELGNVFYRGSISPEALSWDPRKDARITGKMLDAPLPDQLPDLPGMPRGIEL